MKPTNPIVLTIDNGGLKKDFTLFDRDGNGVLRPLPDDVTIVGPEYDGKQIYTYADVADLMLNFHRTIAEMQIFVIAGANAGMNQVIKWSDNYGRTEDAIEYYPPLVIHDQICRFLINRATASKLRIKMKLFPGVYQISFITNP